MKKEDSVAKLKLRIKELEKERSALYDDRALYRNYVEKHFKDNLKCIGTASYYAPKSIVESITTLFAKAEKFHIFW